MQVKYLNLSKQFEDGHIIEAIKDQFKKCQFILGPEVKEFEEKFAQLCQSRYAIGVNSGTDALFLSLKALGIGPDHEVITVPNSFIATTGAIAAAGARPVFVDVNEEYNMNPDLLEKAITPRTKAILPVHLTGNPADMPRIMDIAKKHDLYVIEDACQAVNASINGKPVGSFDTTGCFSLHPLKNLNVCGDGGIIVTNSEGVYEKLMRLRNHGLKNRDEVEFLGYNSRLDTIQAIIASYFMNKLNAVTDKRIGNAQKYDTGLSELSDYIVIPPRRKNVKQVFHVYIIQAQHRDRLAAYLGEKGIETKIHYPIPIHLQKACKYLGYKEGDFPVCEAQAKSIITLPIHQYLTDSEITYVIETIREFYNK